MNFLALLAQTESEGQIATIARTFGVDWPHLLAQIISFSIVCAVLYRFAYRPVLRMLDARRKQIALGLENTEKINAALAGIEAQRQSVMADAQAQATQFLTDAHAIAKGVEEKESQQAIAAAERIVARAHEATAQEHERMLAELRQEVGRLVVLATTAVIGRTVTPADQERLAEDTAKYLKTH